MLTELSARKQRILQAVVHGYVETGEPIGSQWLASRFDFGCRGATLRNEMCEMSEAGLLKQPHTSAGRIPTPMGYRYYVDNLMQPLPLKMRPALRELRRGSKVREDVNEIVRDACRFLVRMTDYPSVASAPTQGDIQVHRVFLAAADRAHVLVVVLFSTGHTESRIVKLARTLRGTTVQYVCERLNTLLAGRSVSEIRSVQAPQQLEVDTGNDALERILSAVRKIAEEVRRDELMFEGASVMFRHPEFRDVLRMEQILADLVEGNAFSYVLRLIGEPDQVAVLIGPESHLSVLDECSVVIRRYQAGSRGWGHIGVLGPTRMHYDRAVAAVELTARALSSVLARTSFS